jgi:pimeloyl-ACP methyl ester carboxylesterase
MGLEFERRRARVSEGEMAYVDVGEGPAVVLLHGFPTSSFLWRREIMLLASRMRVIAPDLLGYGDSDQQPEADLSLVAQADFVRELMEQLGIERVALVGHDIGGGVAQLLALDHGLTVETLVLLDSVCFEAWPSEAVRLFQAARADEETAEVAEDVVRAALVLGMSHRDRLDEETVQGYARPWKTDPRALFRAARGVDGKGLSGREAELAAIDVPTLIIWGEDDPFLPVELGERLGEIIDRATVALLPGCSHFVTEDAPQTVGPLIYEFLRSRYLREHHGHGGGGPVPVFLHRPKEGGFFDVDGGP